MSDPTVIHIVGVTAVWNIFLSAIRFALVGFYGLKPVASCIWHLIRCEGGDRTACRRRLIASLDRQYTELLIAITTPWSVMLLFVGMVTIGAGLAVGSVGDVVQLVAMSPAHWDGFDRSMDMASAVGLCVGMAAVHAAVTKHRSLSLVTSLGFALMGVGIGAVSAVHQ
ncbi:hypothetical protein [Sphingomonas radiodurans]|uniref:hypothetical protein n=1 Tax=Sphingomonas radiodurans TaxID=2890321 RepID=UPI001E5418C1|nr:hypothetical protein [Sphingomonas radiodurans]WBH17039.1 hypothetical protein LLW23_02655 [Sphingomonas radiodurans]